MHERAKLPQRVLRTLYFLYLQLLSFRSVYAGSPVTRRAVWCLISALGLATNLYGAPFQGEFISRYRARWGGASYEDQDLYNYLVFSLPAQEQHRFGGALSVRWDADLQTRSNEFEDSNHDFRVYYLYLDYKDVPNLHLRIGKQVLDDAEGFQINGLHAQARLPWNKLRLSVFGGRPVTYYSDVTGEWSAGGSWAIRSTNSSYLRGSYVHVKEDRAEDDVFTLSYRGASQTGFTYWLTLRTLNFDIWNTFLGADYRIQPLDLQFTGHYRRQSNTNDDTASRYFSQFASSLGASAPYQRITLNLTKFFGDYFSVGAGITRRDLIHSADTTRGNTDFTQLFFTVFLFDNLLGGTEASLDLSHWYSNMNSNSSFSGNIGRRFGTRLMLHLGTFYSKYESVRFFTRPDELPIERFDVRTYYIEGDWRIVDQWRLQVQLERGSDAIAVDPFYQLEVHFGISLPYLFKNRSQ